MLKPACRQFRVELAPGDPHQRSCPACAAYAAAMERAAFKVPLPARLRSKLRAIPGAASPGPRLPLPQAPLPDPLRDRLVSPDSPLELATALFDSISRAASVTSWPCQPSAEGRVDQTPAPNLVRKPETLVTRLVEPGSARSTSAMAAIDCST